MDSVTKQTPRHVVFPIQYPEMWLAYKQAQQAYWTAEEIDLSTDREHWSSVLTANERHFVSMILGFFAVADGIVGENLAERFCRDVDILEAKFFYGFQLMIENVHAEVYGRFVTELMPNDAMQAHLFSAVDNIPVVQDKANWCMRWVDSAEASLATRLAAFAVVEGVFFSSSFAAIFWLRQKGVMPGMTHSNELISRDEGMHVRFAAQLYRELLTRGTEVPPIEQMVREAVQLEGAFFAEALPEPLLGMNITLMTDYIEHVADMVMELLMCAPIYRKSNPFPFMDTIHLTPRVNFFERPVSDYVTAQARDPVLESVRVTDI